LHVLGLPPAFALSQDQTLKLDEILIPAWSRLRSDDTGKCRHIDEVHPLIACTRMRKRSAMYLKREPPKSLPKPLQ
jgi:hypothetical protein